MKLAIHIKKNEAWAIHKTFYYDIILLISQSFKIKKLSKINFKYIYG